MPRSVHGAEKERKNQEFPKRQFRYRAPVSNRQNDRGDSFNAGETFALETFGPRFQPPVRLMSGIQDRELRCQTEQENVKPFTCQTLC